MFLTPKPLFLTQKQGFLFRPIFGFSFVSLVLSYVSCFAKFNFDAINFVFLKNMKFNVFRILRKYKIQKNPSKYVFF